MLAAFAVAAVALTTIGTAAQARTQSPGGPGADAPTGAVVVFGCPDPAGAVHAAGGTVTADLPLIQGVAAELPPGARPGGCGVSANVALTVTGLSSRSGGRVRDVVSGATGSVDGVVSTARQTLGLTDSSPTGAGVTVAVVDTGVANSADLRGRVLHADITGTSWNSDRDDYGHGTFVAGLVAGDASASDGAYEGAAPDARLLDVRVAKDDGSTSLIDVLRGLQFVALTQNAFTIKVLNLSLSSGSPLPYQIDPLSQALEALWHQGIVVVVPAGNDGPDAATISSPGNDPTLLTVGALDEAATADRSDDTVAAYSARGPAEQGVAKPDLVAPGSHLVSLRAPGSVIDDQNPASRVGASYFRGSGTSMSTAVVSGVVADLLSARPGLTPDQVKAILIGSTYGSAALSDPAGAGSGAVDALAALGTATPIVNGDPDSADGADWPARQDRIWDRFSAALLSGDRGGAYQWYLKLSPEARSWIARSWTELSPGARSWVARSWSARSWTVLDWS